MTKYFNISQQFLVILALVTLVFLSGCTKDKMVEQTSIGRISAMPTDPQPYRMLNWHELSKEFDEYVFDFELEGEHLPFIWLDDSRRNFDQTTFGLYTAIGDVRQGADKNNGEFHEAIGSLGALLSAGLNGIDKTDQDGFNYVKMAQNYFNSETAWNIMMNNTNPEVAMLGGGYARDWWYDAFPNVLYYAVADVFPDVERADSLLLIIADQMYKADSVLNGNYHYSFFDYSKMQGVKSHIPLQEDAAAAHAYVLLSAYQKFGDPKYLSGAKSAMDALLSQKESRFYEVLLPFGAYVAARLNAEHQAQHDVKQIIDWSFDGTHAKDGRYGWGVIRDKWADYDVSGLVGSWHHDGGFAFAMNTFDMAWPLVPMVRYAPQYADAVGKWMLNAANAARLFYPHEIPDANQWLPEKKAITRNVIAYEGLKKTNHVPKASVNNATPVAVGDGPLWVEGQPDESVFSVYGSAHAGIFGAIIRETNVPKILKLDCLATDFYRNDAYPTYLIYNPYETEKTIDYQIATKEAVKLFDVLSKQELKAEGINNSIQIPALSSRLIVEVPAELKIQKKNGQWLAGDVVIAF
ncbi:MAG: hypothetical protein RBR87_03960 [Bacteroidales bacterium]|jgi:hypothetical protein|nr:hypothetical protein [Bacteroidales bacterium]